MPRWRMRCGATDCVWMEAPSCSFPIQELNGTHPRLKGHMKNHRADLKTIARRAMIERGFLPDFSSEAMAELAGIETAATEWDSNIRDLTGLLWASIDNDDSRDLDQLSVAEPHPDRSVTILVAIADVDALVMKESALDTHAKHNTTSVYTAGDMFPMLPEKLSTDLTSLDEGQDRLAIVVEMDIAEDGAVLSSTLFRALVRNHAKLAYNSVAAWLAGEARAPERLDVVPGLDAQLRLQDQVAQRLKARRHEQGALSLETIEPQVVFDGEMLTDLRVEQKNRAKELIEEFMIAANQATVSYLKGKGMLPVPSHSALSRTLAAHSGICRTLEWAFTTGAGCEGARIVPRHAPEGRSPHVSRFVPGHREAHRQRRICAGSVDRMVLAGTFRACGEGVHPFYGSQPPLSRSYHSAADQSGVGRCSNAVPSRRTEVSGRPLHGARTQCGKSRAAAPQIRSGVIARIADWAAFRRDRDGYVRQKHVGPAS